MVQATQHAVYRAQCDQRQRQRTSRARRDNTRSRTTAVSHSCRSRALRMSYERLLPSPDEVPRCCRQDASQRRRPTSHKIGAQFQLVDVLSFSSSCLASVSSLPRPRRRHLVLSRLAINFLVPVAGRVYLPPPSSLVDSEVHGLALCLIWRSKCSTSGRPALVQLVLWPKI